MFGPSQDRVTFDGATARVLAALADTLIPPGDGFPWPSDTRIVEDFMTRYVVADERRIVYIPGVTVSDVAALVGVLGHGFASGSEEERAAAVSALESADAELFARVRALVYAGYYSRPVVRAAIANTLEAGRDFRGAPQPYGYADVIEEWDESQLARRGSYLRTEDVQPLDRDKIARLIASWKTTTDDSTGGAV